jgi:site-specific recombinase XerC
MTRIINKELVAAWGLREPDSITPEEVEDWCRRIASGDGRKKAAPYLANRSFDYMALVYSWAAQRRLLRYTPFVGLEKPLSEQKRSRTFSNEELRRLVEALKQAPKQIAGLWLLLLYTGNRLRETRPFGIETSAPDSSVRKMAEPPAGDCEAAAAGSGWVAGAWAEDGWTATGKHAASPTAQSVAKGRRKRLLEPPR